MFRVDMSMRLAPGRAKDSGGWSPAEAGGDGILACFRRTGSFADLSLLSGYDSVRRMT